MHGSPISINQVTVQQWSLQQTIEALEDVPGVEGLGVWPDKLSQATRDGAWKMIHDAGLHASSLTFVANFTLDLHRAIERGKRAIDDAVAVGCSTLVVVAGPRTNLSREEGDRLTRQGLDELSHRARHAGVTLALEPWHPMDVARYSTVVSIAQALQIIEGLPATGITLDLWNTWWDPHFDESLHKAAGWISLVQVSDWRHPGQDPTERTYPGDGIMPLAEMIQKIDQIGYTGWYEVELFTTRWNPQHYPELLRQCVLGTQRVLPSRTVQPYPAEAAEAPHVHAGL